MAFDTLIKAGTTSKIIEVMVRDSTTGAGKTGLAHGSVSAYYTREGGTATLITLASGTAGDSYSSGKWAEVSATNAKGLYQLHLPNAMITTGVASVSLNLQASGMIDTFFRIGLPVLDFFATSVDADVISVASGERDALAAALLDLIDGIETGVTLRKAVRAIAATAAGKRTNAGTGTEVYDAIGNAGTARVTPNCDAAGDGTPTLNL